jgi:hypothetical protein
MFGSHRDSDLEVLPEPRVRKRLFGRKWIFLFFFLIIGSLLFFAFSGEVSLTGNVIGVGGSIDEANAFPLTARLTPLGVNESLEFDQFVERMVFEFEPVNQNLLLGKDLVINVGELDDPTIVFESFDGTLIFDSGSVLLLKGKAGKVSVNGVSVGGTGVVSVSFDGSVPYDKLSLSNVYLRSYNAVTSGSVEAKDKTFFELDQEEIVISKFRGDVKSGNVGSIGISREGLLFSGLAERMSLKGAVNAEVRA